MITYPSSCESKTAPQLLQEAILELCQKVIQHTSQTRSVLILSDRDVDQNKVAMPDFLAVAAVRKCLEERGLQKQCPIIVDSQQVIGPQQFALLLGMGAQAVFPRAAYNLVHHLCETNQQFNQTPAMYMANYTKALQTSLLKIMGKMGITDVNNYINGNLFATLGLDLETDHPEGKPSLASIFKGTISYLKGFTLQDVADASAERHRMAMRLHTVELPRMGYFKPESNGIKHGFGLEVVNAFTEWMKGEDIRDTLWYLHNQFKKEGKQDFVEEKDYTPETGFLDSGFKDSQGFYPPAYLEKFIPSTAWNNYSQTVTEFRRAHPTCLYDLFQIRPSHFLSVQNSTTEAICFESQESIRKKLFTGSMSQGALTVASLDEMDQPKAHETICQGANAVGSMSSAGEGGENREQMKNYLTTARSKQVASGRFGVSVYQINNAEEVEIKIAQGAKPGEGGQLPGFKVTVRFASQRGSLPGIPLISPPPHHDIYSIEDLEQLIYDIKSVNPQVRVCVKLVASAGIGTIACGVAKGGADSIHIAGNSGGTGAAAQTSMKHAGLPSEVGLVEVDQALRVAGLRDYVLLKTSGGFKTGWDVVLAAIFGADTFEFGTVMMMTVGCKMQRTCNTSCEPGVAKNPEKFKGRQINVERFLVNVAAEVQHILRQINVVSLQALRGRTDLLTTVDRSLAEKFTLNRLLERPRLQSPAPSAPLGKSFPLARRDDEYIQMLKTHGLQSAKQLKPIALGSVDRSFGARIAGTFSAQLSSANEFTHVEDQGQTAHLVTIPTCGDAGQSYAMGACDGLRFVHEGTVAEGVAKSMSGGEVIIKGPVQKAHKLNKDAVAGNAALYGASGGYAFIRGGAANRFAILLKGAHAVVESVGDRACEYMTSGTVLILGPTGYFIGSGSSGGIIFVYDLENRVETRISSDVRVESDPSRRATYLPAIRQLLALHALKAESSLAQSILDHFETLQSHFKVLIPIELDKITTPSQVCAILQTYRYRSVPISLGMRIWLTNTLLNLHASLSVPVSSFDVRSLILEFQKSDNNIIQEKRKAANDSLDLLLEKAKKAESIESKNGLTDMEDVIKEKRDVKARLSGIKGQTDVVFGDILEKITQYCSLLYSNAQGCTTCRAQSCSGSEVDTGCPEEKPINSINGKLQELGVIRGQPTIRQWIILREAFNLQKSKTPFFAFTGMVCPAPCEDACTEGIPDDRSPTGQGQKDSGEPVHIKDIELYLYKLGRYMGWFEAAPKVWSAEAQGKVFGSAKQYQRYLNELQKPIFQPVFARNSQSKGETGIVVSIVGSGPAGMEIAFHALLDGHTVHMYERSDKPGGLLTDGIPMHKYDKEVVYWHFEQLQAMGLRLHLNTSVQYNEARRVFYLNDSLEAVVCEANQPDHYLFLCTGAGMPKQLSEQILEPNVDRTKIVQAVDFLQSANHLAHTIQSAQPPLPENRIQELITQTFAGTFDPRHGKVAIIGGGDTAQDAIRWFLRYFNTFSDKRESQGLDILVRAHPTPLVRTIGGQYPANADSLSKENNLRDEEIIFSGARNHFLSEPVKVGMNGSRLEITMAQKELKYYQDLAPHLKKRYDSLPRSARPTRPTGTQVIQTDTLLLALGFQGGLSHPLTQQTALLSNVFVAGDASHPDLKSKSAKPQAWIIVGAQKNAYDTYTLFKNTFL